MSYLGRAPKSSPRVPQIGPRLPAAQINPPGPKTLLSLQPLPHAPPMAPFGHHIVIVVFSRRALSYHSFYPLVVAAQDSSHSSGAAGSGRHETDDDTSVWGGESPSPGPLVEPRVAEPSEVLAPAEPPPLVLAVVPVPVPPRATHKRWDVPGGHIVFNTATQMLDAHCHCDCHHLPGNKCRRGRSVHPDAQRGCRGRPLGFLLAWLHYHLDVPEITGDEHRKAADLPIKRRPDRDVLHLSFARRMARREWAVAQGLIELLQAEVPAVPPNFVHEPDNY